jgi:hypothetical protein
LGEAPDEAEPKPSGPLAVGAGSVLEDELTGGVLGLVLLLGYLLLFAWILVTSVIMWRAGSRQASPAPTAEPATAG